MSKVTSIVLFVILVGVSCKNLQSQPVQLVPDFLEFQGDMDGSRISRSTYNYQQLNSVQKVQKQEKQVLIFDGQEKQMDGSQIIDEKDSLNNLIKVSLQEQPLIINPPRSDNTQPTQHILDVNKPITGQNTLSNLNAAQSQIQAQIQKRKLENQAIRQKQRAKIQAQIQKKRLQQFEKAKKMLEDRRQAVRRQYQQQQREQEQREKDNPNKQYRLYCGSNTKFILPEQKVDPNARQKLVATVHGFNMYVDNKDSMVSRSILVGGTWEPGYINLIGHLIKPGDSVLNLGSQSGLQAIIMGKIVGQKGKLFIFEPYSFSNTLIIKNIELNKLKDITTIYKYGASDQKGKSSIQINYYNTGGSQIVPLQKKTTQTKQKPYPYGPYNEVQEVDTDLVDNLLPKDIKLNFALLDVQKMEIKALRGMREVIKRSPNLIIMTQWQYGQNPRRNQSQTVQFLNSMIDMNYGIYSYSGGNYQSCTAGKFYQFGDVRDLLRINFLDIFFIPRNLSVQPQINRAPKPTAKYEIIQRNMTNLVNNTNQRNRTQNISQGNQTRQNNITQNNTVQNNTAQNNNITQSNITLNNTNITQNNLTQNNTNRTQTNITNNNNTQNNFTQNNITLNNSNLTQANNLTQNNLTLNHTNNNTTQNNTTHNNNTNNNQTQNNNNTHNNQTQNNITYQNNNQIYNNLTFNNFTQNAILQNNTINNNFTNNNTTINNNNLTQNNVIHNNNITQNNNLTLNNITLNNKTYNNITANNVTYNNTNINVTQNNRTVNNITQDNLTQNNLTLGNNTTTHQTQNNQTITINHTNITNTTNTTELQIQAKANNLTQQQAQKQQFKYCGPEIYSRPRTLPPQKDITSRQRQISTIYGFNLYIDKYDMLLSRQLQASGTWEPGYINLIGHLVKAGDSVLNLGSQSGLEAVIMGKIVGDKGKLYIFEPYSFSNKLVTENIKLNGLSSITTIYKYGASDQKGQAVIKVSYSNTGGSQIYLNQNATPSLPAQTYGFNEIQKIQIDRVDSILPSNVVLNFALLDVEKMETKALKGMKQIIKRSPNLVIMTEWQYGQNPRRNEAETLELLTFMKQSLGYRIYSYSGGSDYSCTLGQFYQYKTFQELLNVNFIDIFFIPDNYPIPK